MSFDNWHLKISSQCFLFFFSSLPTPFSFFPSFLFTLFFFFLSGILQLKPSNVSLWLASVKLQFDKNIPELMLKFFIATYHVVYDFSLSPSWWCFFWQVVPGGIYQFFLLLVSITLISSFIFGISFFPVCLLCQADGFYFLLYL